MIEYVVGQKVLIEMFFDRGTTAVDPATVEVRVKDPSGNTTTYTYADEEITQVESGYYTVEFVADEKGIWRWAAESTGSNAAAETGRFLVVRAEA
jgi:uncharacterized protein YfaS (alpha-2-macroglobulin family)